MDFKVGDVVGRTIRIPGLSKDEVVSVTIVEVNGLFYKIRSGDDGAVVEVPETDLRPLK